MMRIDVRSNVDDLVRDLGTMGMKQAPFAVRDAIEVTAINVGRALETKMLQTFRGSVQGRGWIRDHVKVFRPGGSRLLGSLVGSSRAQATSRTDARIWIGVIPPGTRGLNAGFDRYRGSLLPMMERGGMTPGPRAFGGNAAYGRYAVPVARYDSRPRHPLSLWPINLGLQARRSISGPLTSGGLRGKHRTYLVPITNAPGHAMIFQRFGKGKGSDSMPIFWTMPQTRVPSRPYFLSTVQPLVQQILPIHLRRSLDHALFSRGSYADRSQLVSR